MLTQTSLLLGPWKSIYILRYEDIVGFSLIAYSRTMAYILWKIQIEMKK